MSEKFETPIIASPLKIEPSPIDLIDSLGMNAEKFVNESQLRSYAIANLPPKEVAKLFSKKMGFNYKSLLEQLRDFFSSVKCLNESEEQQTWLPMWEIHRPKCNDCTATLKKTTSSNTDYSMTIKVFGIGGGVTISKKIGLTQSIQAKKECLQTRLPVTFTILECETKKGEKFNRINPKDIGTILSTKELKDEHDHCGVNPNHIVKAGWDKHVIEVAPDAVQTLELSVESSQGVELSLEPTIGNTSLGMTTVLKLNKSHTYSYEITGAGRYLAYFPKNSISWYWTHPASFSDFNKMLAEKENTEKQKNQYIPRVRELQ